MRLLYAVAGCTLLILILMSFMYKGTSTNFYGIAETRELTINSENTVEVKKIHVAQGQAIRQGDTLIELNSPELMLQISEITRELDKLKMERQVLIGKIRTELRQLEAQYELNRRSVSDLRSFSKSDRATGGEVIVNPLKVQIDNLRRELSAVIAASPKKSNVPQIDGNSAPDPVKILVSQMEDELKLLYNQKDRLISVSPIDGVVDSVNYKEGEKVSSFMSIITLHAKYPSFIKGYINENLHHTISMGQKVQVVSLGDKRNTVIGDVVGVGSRIVEFPTRLLKMADMLIWGREVIIKIPPENSFLLGEKLRIVPLKAGHKALSSMLHSISLVPSACAQEPIDASLPPSLSPAGLNSRVNRITISSRLSPKTALEASAIHYLHESKEYIVLSDDTKKKDHYSF